MGKRLTAMLTVALAVTLIAGCAAEPTDPFDQAWAACVEMNEGLYPDGLEDAEDGQVLNAEEICHSTVAAQGEDRFTKLFLDAEWVECFAAGREQCTPPE